MHKPNSLQSDIIGIFATNWNQPEACRNLSIDPTHTLSKSTKIPGMMLYALHFHLISTTSAEVVYSLASTSALWSMLRCKTFQSAGSGIYACHWKQPELYPNLYIDRTLAAISSVAYLMWRYCTLLLLLISTDSENVVRIISKSYDIFDDNGLQCSTTSINATHWR